MLLPPSALRGVYDLWVTDIVRWLSVLGKMRLNPILNSKYLSLLKDPLRREPKKNIKFYFPPPRNKTSHLLFFSVNLAFRHI